MPRRAVVLAAVAVAALGTAGLARGVLPRGNGGTVSVSDAYVRAPVAPNVTAAAYFVIHNATSRDDQLESVRTSAGGPTMLHVVGAGGAMSAFSGPVRIRAGATFTLRLGASHLMIEQPVHPVVAGQRVRLTLVLRDAGTITVQAPVVAVGAAAPTGDAAGHS